MECPREQSGHADAACSWSTRTRRRRRAVRSMVMGTDHFPQDGRESPSTPSPRVSFTGVFGERVAPIVPPSSSM